jgi:hypothetical protein
MPANYIDIPTLVKEFAAPHSIYWHYLNGHPFFQPDQQGTPQGFDGIIPRPGQITEDIECEIVGPKQLPPIHPL